MSPETNALTGRALNAALTTALAEIQADHLGERPAKASSFYRGNVVITLMHDVLTNAESILARNGHAADVSDVRHASSRPV